MRRRFVFGFTFVGILIGILFTWHLSTPLPVKGDFFSDEETARQELLKNFLDEQSYLQSRIVSLRKQIDDSQVNIETTSETINLELRENLKDKLGLNEVTGSGIEILLDDSPLVVRNGVQASDKELIQASDIRDIINLLYAGNAEGISVNNQRVISTSGITSVGTTILINNAYIAPPFIINAVGDQEILVQRLLNKSTLESLFQRVKDFKLAYKINLKNRLTIPIYNSDLNADHINLVKQ